MKTSLLMSAVATTLLVAYPNGSRIPSGHSGEPGSGTPCASCHSVTLNPAGGRVSLALPGGSSFVAGEPQRWSIAVSDPNTSFRRGFQMTVSAGTLAAVSGTVVNSAVAKPYASQTSSAASWTVDWTPPANAETVMVYLAGFAGSGTRQGNVYTASFTLTKAAATTARPAIGGQGVVNAASFAPGISPGAWLTIYGTALAPTGVARSWTAAEVASGTLPVSLEGTSVRINGKPSAISYVSEGQLNVQAPADETRGDVAVDVTTAAGAGTPVTATLAGATPGLFRFSTESHRYVAAVHADGTPVLPVSSSSRPAQPGEIVLLFGTGFGRTTPDVAPGTAFSGAAPLAEGAGLTVRIGGVAADVKFAGLTAAGLFQINVVVPDLPDGDHAVEASAWGSGVPTQQYLPVRRQ